MFWKMFWNIGFGIIIPTITGIYFYCRKTKSNEIMEVLWTNNLSQNCEYSVSQHLPKNNLCNKSYCALYKIQRIKDCIENAKYSLDLAMHIFTFKEISDSISRAFKNGVRVRIICCNCQKDSTGAKVNDLNREGVPIRFQESKGSELMHHKFCIIDGKRRTKNLIKYENIKCKSKPESLLLSGSCNWTGQALHVNWENILITSNDILINQFEEEFEKIWISFRRG